MLEERVLIKSIRSEKAYRNTLIFLYVIAIGSAFLFAIAIGSDAVSRVPSWESVLNENAESEAFFKSFWMCLFIWGIFFSLPFSALPHFLLHKIYYRQNITVTDQRVRCTLGFKDEMNIPITAISSVTVNSGIFKSVGLTCAGNRYSITYIENCQEIYAVINSLLNQNRSKSNLTTSTINVTKGTNVNVTDEIRKYKQLLDDGIILQEEFEAKKKQLLNI